MEPARVEAEYRTERPGQATGGPQGPGKAAKISRGDP
jgi:hypothetical protein